MPLVSSTCAYRINSAPEDLILFIPFTVQCVKVGSSDFLTNGRRPEHFTDRYSTVGLVDDCVLNVNAIDSL